MEPAIGKVRVNAGQAAILGDTGSLQEKPERVGTSERGYRAAAPASSL